MHKFGAEQLKLNLGNQVEVTRNIDGWRNSWYKATIIPPNPLSKWKNNHIWVEYDTILDNLDPLKKLQEYINILLIRPLPPIAKNYDFHKYDYIDAYRKNGWYTGVLLHVFNDGFKYLVAFLYPYEEFLFERSQLRVHLEWGSFGVDGSKCRQWHGPKKMRVAFCAPNVGVAVEGSLLESTRAMVGTGEPTPSPAKKLKETTSGNAKGRGSSEMNNAEKSRDSPQKFTISPKVLDSSEPNDEKPKQTINNDEVRRSSEPNDAEPSQDEPQKFFQPRPFTPVVSSKGNTNCSGKRKASEGQNSSSLSLSPNDLQEDIEKNDDSHSSSPAKLNRVSEVDDPEKVIYEQGDCQSKGPVSYPEHATTECPKTCPLTICFSRRSDKSQAWPFTKRSSIWKLIESMEVFKRVPQMPHFSPLNELEENSRELIAISMMMKFSYLAERISAGSPDELNSPTIIQAALKSLDELESHGFNITPLQVYVNEQLEKISMEKELKRNMEEVDNRILKCQVDKAALERKVNELAKQIKSLQEQIKSEKSVKYLKDLHLANLVFQRDIISRKLDTFHLTKKPPFEWVLLYEYVNYVGCWRCIKAWHKLVEQRSLSKNKSE